MTEYHVPNGTFERKYHTARILNGEASCFVGMLLFGKLITRVDEESCIFEAWRCWSTWRPHVNSVFRKETAFIRNSNTDNNPNQQQSPPRTPLTPPTERTSTSHADPLQKGHSFIFSSHSQLKVNLQPTVTHRAPGADWPIYVWMWVFERA